MRVRVEVADDQDVARRRCRSGRRPASRASAMAALVRTMLQLPCPSPCVGGVAGAALRLEVVDVDDEARPVGRLERLGERWSAAQLRQRRCRRLSPPSTNAGVLSAPVVADRGHRRRAIDEADLDGVVAGGVELAGRGVDVDEGVGARRRRGVEPVDEVGDRARRAVAVVLDLVDADDVGIERRGSRRRSWATAASNSACVSAPRQPVGGPPTPLRQLSTVSGRPSNVLK